MEREKEFREILLPGYNFFYVPFIPHKLFKFLLTQQIIEKQLEIVLRSHSIFPPFSSLSDLSLSLTLPFLFFTLNSPVLSFLFLICLPLPPLSITMSGFILDGFTVGQSSPKRMRRPDAPLNDSR